MRVSPPISPTVSPLDLLLAWLHASGGEFLSRRAATFSRDDWRALAVLAARQGVSGLVCRRLIRLGLAGQVYAPAWADLRADWRSGARRNLVYFRELRRLLGFLAARGLETILLKGAHLAWSVYPDLSLRPMVDLDLLVPAHRIKDAWLALDAAGYVGLHPGLEEDLDTVLRQGKHIPARLDPTGACLVEVHFRLSMPGEPQLDPAGMMARAEALPAGGARGLSGLGARAFCPEDAMLYLCFHCVYSHTLVMGARGLTDLAFLIEAHPGLDWRALARRAREWGITRGVWLCLNLAAELVGAAVPESALRDILSGDSSGDSSGDFSGELSGEMPGDLMDAAMAQIFSLEAGLLFQNRGLEVLAGQGGLMAKVWFAAGQFFLSPAAMRARYDLPADSARFVWYYPRRFFECLRRYAWVAIGAARGRADFGPAMRREALLTDWLYGRGGASPDGRIANADGPGARATTACLEPGR